MKRRFNELSPTYKRRNQLLLSLFDKFDMNVSLLGDLRKPNMIVDNSYQLPMYVKNFDLHIKKTVYSEDYFHTFSLDDVDLITKEEFDEILDQAETEWVYKVKYHDLYYVGMKKDNSTGEYFPAFSKQFPKLYYTTDKAIEESYHLRTLGYETEYE